MDFPLLKTFDVDFEIVNFLNRKFELYKRQHQSYDEQENCFTNKDHNSGYQTTNLLYWDDLEYKNFIENNLLDVITKVLSLDRNRITYFWNHILDYTHGGMMQMHKHMHNEDYVFFIYLNSCKDGETVFYLNDSNPEYMERTKVGILPNQNLGACFSSMLLHEGKMTTQNKRIFVCGIRIDLRGEFNELQKMQNCGTLM